MLVEDDGDIRSGLVDFLEDNGVTVLTARDGREALDLLAKIEPPCLILLDLMMPVMGGSQFLAARQAHPRLQTIPVVILSAWIQKWVRDGAGVEEVLMKPVDTEQLLTVVNRYCGRTGSIP
jgi:CheY-like chemotaxis protein